MRRLASQGVSGDWRLAYCSRSGAPGQPWLEPDINDVLRTLASEGVRDVCVAPIGFISDHMEVLFDLDTEAAATALSCGIRMHRAGTAGTRPEFINGVIDLLIERAAIARGEEASSARIDLGCTPAQAICAVDCCANPRAARPALCQEGA